MSGVSLRFPLLRRQLLRSFSTSKPHKPDHARIVEVGPRDGLQNEKKSIPLQTKIELVNRLAKTGVTHMEAGSFVPAKWVPQVRSHMILCFAQWN
jgi:hydroxymethylglutaryl-CoA lyase